MKYNVRKWNPLLIGIPDIGIGVMWGALGNVIAFMAYHFTDKATDIAKIYMLAAVVGVITQIFVGYLSDRTKHKWGKRSPWLFYGMVLSGVSVFLWPFAGSFTVYLILVTLTCILVNIAQCAYYTMVMEVVDHDQVGAANTIARTTSTVGSLLMGVVAGFLWSNQHPSVSFICMGLIMIIATVVIVPTVVKERPENYISHQKQTFSLEFLTNVEALKVFAITFLYFAASTGIVQMGTSLFVKTYGVQEHVVGRFSIFGTIVSLAFGVLAFGFIDKIDKKWMFVISTIGLICDFIFLKINLHVGIAPHTLYIWTTLYGLFFLIGNIAMYSVLPIVAPKGKLGWYMGLLNFAIALPQFIMSDVYGHLIDSGKANMIMPLIISFYVIGLIIALTLKLRKKEAKNFAEAQR